MKIAILGAGALGTLYAAHLARSGNQVSLIARGERAGLLQRDGLTVTGQAGFSARCSIVTNPATVGPVDLLILTPKTYDTAEALAAVRNVDTESIFSVQNGVEKNEALVAAFGAGRTLGATTFMGGLIESNGAARYTMPADTVVGELSGGLSPRVERIVSALQTAGLQAEASPDIRSVEWSKFTGWSGFMSVSALTRLNTWAFLSDPDSARIAARIMRETGTLAGHLGIALQDRGALPVARLLAGDENTATAMLLATGAELKKKAPQMRQSTLQDLDRGRRLEIEETLGYTVTQAAAAGLAMPTVDACYRLIAAISRSNAAAA